MDDFFDRVILDNSIFNYLVTAGIILLVLLLQTIISRLVAGTISRMVINKKQMDNRKLFRGLVIPPIRFFVIVLTSLIAIYRLNFPAVLDIKIYRTDLHTIVDSLARAILIFSFIWLSNRIVAYIAALLHARALETSDRTDDQLIVFFRDFFKVIIWIFGVLLVLKFSFGFAMSNVFTGLSIVGAALALAFRESLENLIASFIIFFDKPFTIGDLVKVQNVNGTVERIGLRSTRIRTTEKTYVTVPNKQMVDSILDNQSLRTQRNVQHKVEVSAATTAAQLAAIIQSIESLLDKEEVLDKNVFLSDTGKDTNIIQVEYFVTMELPIKEFYKFRENINLGIIKILEESKKASAKENN